MVFVSQYASSLFLSRLGPISAALTGAAFAGVGVGFGLTIGTLGLSFFTGAVGVAFAAGAAFVAGAAFAAAFAAGAADDGDDAADAAFAAGCGVLLLSLVLLSSGGGGLRSPFFPLGAGAMMVSSAGSVSFLAAPLLLDLDFVFGAAAAGSDAVGGAALS